MTVRFRLYQPDDFAALYAIEEICFQPPFRFGRRFMRQIVTSARGATWIAEEEGSMAGFGIVEWEDAFNAISYIQTLEVLPSMRGRGIGRELLRRLEVSAGSAGANAVWLHVDAENKEAIRLYEACGYRCAGREQNYYAARRDAFVYQKELSGTTGTAKGK